MIGSFVQGSFRSSASLIHLRLPVMLTKTIDLIQQTSTPLALPAIGAGFEFKTAGEIASPAAASGYIMVREMKGDAVLSSFIIVLSTLFSAFTLTLWIFLLKNPGYLG